MFTLRFSQEASKIKTNEDVIKHYFYSATSTGKLQSKMSAETTEKNPPQMFTDLLS